MLFRLAFVVEGVIFVMRRLIQGGVGRRALTLILQLCTSSEVLAAQSIDFANDSYSNVRLIKSENDLVGWRIQIIKSESKVFVLVQSFEGVPQEPCFTEAKLEKNGDIQFTLPDSCVVTGIFRGVVSKMKLTGGFDNGMTGPNGEAVMILKRTGL